MAAENKRIEPLSKNAFSPASASSARAGRHHLPTFQPPSKCRSTTFSSYSKSIRLSRISSSERSLSLDSQAGIKKRIMGKGGQRNTEVAVSSGGKKLKLDHMETEVLRKWAKAYGVKDDLDREKLLIELVRLFPATWLFLLFYWSCSMQQMLPSAIFY